MITKLSNLGHPIIFVCVVFLMLVAGSAPGEAQPPSLSEGLARTTSAHKAPEGKLHLSGSLIMKDFISKVSRFTRQDYHIDEELDTQVSLTFPEKVTRAEAARFLETTMLLAGYRLDKTNGMKWRFVRVSRKDSFEFRKIRIEVEDSFRQRGLHQKSPAVGYGKSARKTTSVGQDVLVAKFAIDQATANLPRTFSMARAVPFFRNGKSIGHRVFAIRRNSIYSKMGLINGDILLKVDGEQLLNPADSLSIFERLSKNGVIKILLERNGKERSFVCRVEE